MPLDWPNHLPEQEIDIRPSALKWHVIEEDIWEVLRIPPHRLARITYGKIHDRNDREYGSRSIVGVGTTYRGTPILIVLRFDNRKVSDYSCLVFHAEYL